MPAALYTETQIRQMEQLALDTHGVSLYQLMSRAGEAAFNVLQQHFHSCQSVSVCIGTGNNGGDGLVLARLAKAQGLSVHVYQVGDVIEQRLSEQARRARQEWLSLGGEIHPFSQAAFDADVIVDALLGIGAKHPLKPNMQAAIDMMNASGVPIFSIDLPSGLDASTGQSQGAIRATATVTFAALKVGLFTGQACDHVGYLYFDDIGISRTSIQSITPIAQRLVFSELIQELPPRAMSAHKGNNGHLCVIGAGVPAYSGAVGLCSEAALRTGAGLVSAVVAPESIPLMARAPLEVMCHGMHKAKELKNLLLRVDAIVLGPGLADTSWSTDCYQSAMAFDKPMVVDADGLNALAKKPIKRNHWVLTPHPKEAARLLNTTVDDVQRDRMGSAQALAQKYGGVVVLKGAGTVIADESSFWIQEGGFPVLATGGTGDVLAGMIGALLAQGLSLLQAAQIGVSVHAQAASIEQSLGSRGMLASDLFLHIRSLMNV